MNREHEMRARAAMVTTTRTPPPRARTTPADELSRELVKESEVRGEPGVSPQDADHFCCPNHGSCRRALVAEGTPLLRTDQRLKRKSERGDPGGEYSTRLGSDLEVLVMGAEDPEQAILDKLGGPVGVWEPHSVSSGGIQSGTVRGGNLERADLSTVRFVKHRRSERRHLYFVTYSATIPHLGPETQCCHYVYPVEPDPGGGWRVRGGAGGAGRDRDGPRRGSTSAVVAGPTSSLPADGSMTPGSTSTALSCGSRTA
jgi:hypothetical protein